MAAESQTIDALGQFKLETVFGPLGASVNFTQSNLMMLVACVLVLGTLYLGMRPKALVPGRLQTLAEGKGVSFLAAKPEHTGDNAGMIAFAAWIEQLGEAGVSGMDLTIDPALALAAQV